MMSLQSIRQLSDEQAKKAARKHKLPYVMADMMEVDNFPPFPFPNIGSYVPKGWEKTEAEFFVDDEPALSLNQFKAALRGYVSENPGHGFAITEEGEFQCYVTAFRKI
jgi:hypothetical protein